MSHFFRESKSLRASKLLYWFKSYGHFAAWADFAYRWSCIRKGLPCSLRTVQCAAGLLNKVVDIVAGGYVINGATPSSFITMRANVVKETRLITNNQDNEPQSCGSYLDRDTDPQSCD